jgi:uncharacterized membrane protein
VSGERVALPRGPPAVRDSSAVTLTRRHRAATFAAVALALLFAPAFLPSVGRFATAPAASLAGDDRFCGHVALGILFAPASARAQETGGSFGGGDFSDTSSGSSSDSSGGGSWGSSSDSDWGSSGSVDWGSGGGGGGAGGAGLGAGFCLCLGIVVLLVLVAAFRKKSGGGAPPPYTGPNPMFASQLTLGIDWRARREVQEQLARLAASGQAGTKEGRAHLLRETVLALRRAELSWLYVGYRDGGGPLGPAQAQQTFTQWASDARARFKKELVRGDAMGVREQQAPELRARSHEGQGTVVVHLIVVARRPLAGVAQTTSADAIRRALSERGALDADALVALEVVWSPAAENDRMSSAELEQFYPEVRLIDPNTIAGRVFCSYCNGPFAMELLTCPHCGAPAPRQPQGPAGAAPA